MAKAAVSVTNRSIGAGGKLSINYQVDVDNGMSFGADVVLDFTKNEGAINAEIKTKARADVTDNGGPALGINDVVLFGGATQ